MIFFNLKLFGVLSIDYLLARPPFDPSLISGSPPFLTRRMPKVKWSLFRMKLDEESEVPRHGLSNPMDDDGDPVGDEEHGGDPVSYTHLDVYKRQEPDGAGDGRYRGEDRGDPVGDEAKGAAWLISAQAPHTFLVKSLNPSVDRSRTAEKVRSHTGPSMALSQEEENVSAETDLGFGTLRHRSSNASCHRASRVTLATMITNSTLLQLLDIFNRKNPVYFPCCGDLLRKRRITMSCPP